METQVFLPSIKKRLEYMVSKGYFSEEPVLASGDSDMLEYTNFHYLLGYCRNYHKLKKEGAIPGKPALSEVLDIVRMDTQVSSLIYNYLRQAEQALRTAWVHVFCDERSPFEYLNPDAYYSTNQNKTGETLTRDMMRHILRYREPYVRERIEKWWKSCSRDPHTRLEHLEDWGDIEELRKKMQRELPLWSVVDSFSMGVLSRAVSQSILVAAEESVDIEKMMLYKKTAEYMGINHKHFEGRLKSLTTLRNRVAHGSRLWMMPTTDTSAKPKIFAKDLREADRKGMLVSFANVALLQGNTRRQREAWKAIKALVEQNESYRVGVGSQKIF